MAPGLRARIPAPSAGPHVAAVLAALARAQITPELVQPPPGAPASRRAEALERLDAPYDALQPSRGACAMYDLAYEAMQLPFSSDALAKLDAESLAHLDAVERVAGATDDQGRSLLDRFAAADLQAGPTSHGYYRYEPSDVTTPALGMDALSISFPRWLQIALSPLVTAIAMVRVLGLYPSCAYRHDLGSAGSCAGNLSYCEAPPNSSGNAARQDLWPPCYDPAHLPDTDAPFFLVSGAPAGSTGVPFSGGARTRLPFGQGLLCVASPLHRSSATFALEGTGQMSNTMHVSLSASARPGDTLYHQAWFRDPGLGHAGLKNAVAGTLGP